MCDKFKDDEIVIRGATANDMVAVADMIQVSRSFVIIILIY